MININTGSGFDPLMSEAEIEGYFFGPNSFDGKPPATQYVSRWLSAEWGQTQGSHIVCADVGYEFRQDDNGTIV